MVIAGDPPQTATSSDRYARLSQIQNQIRGQIATARGDGFLTARERKAHSNTPRVDSHSNSKVSTAYGGPGTSSGYGTATPNGYGATPSGYGNYPSINLPTGNYSYGNSYGSNASAAYSGNAGVYNMPPPMPPPAGGRTVRDHIPQAPRCDYEGPPYPQADSIMRFNDNMEHSMRSVYSEDRNLGMDRSYVESRPPPFDRSYPVVDRSYPDDRPPARDRSCAEERSYTTRQRDDRYRDDRENPYTQGPYSSREFGRVEMQGNQPSYSSSYHINPGPQSARREGGYDKLRRDLGGYDSSRRVDDTRRPEDDFRPQGEYRRHDEDFIREDRNREPDRAPLSGFRNRHTYHGNVNIGRRGYDENRRGRAEERRGYDQDRRGYDDRAGFDERIPRADGVRRQESIPRDDPGYGCQFLGHYDSARFEMQGGLSARTERRSLGGYQRPPRYEEPSRYDGQEDPRLEHPRYPDERDQRSQHDRDHRSQYADDRGYQSDRRPSQERLQRKEFDYEEPRYDRVEDGPYCRVGDDRHIQREEERYNQRKRERYDCQEDQHVNHRHRDCDGGMTVEPGLLSVATPDYDDIPTTSNDLPVMGGVHDDDNPFTSPVDQDIGPSQVYTGHQTPEMPPIETPPDRHVEPLSSGRQRFDTSPEPGRQGLSSSGLHVESPRVESARDNNDMERVNSSPTTLAEARLAKGRGTHQYTDEQINQPLSPFRLSPRSQQKRDEEIHQQLRDQQKQLRERRMRRDQVQARGDTVIDPNDNIIAHEREESIRSRIGVEQIDPSASTNQTQRNSREQRNSTNPTRSPVSLRTPLSARHEKLNQKFFGLTVGQINFKSDFKPEVRRESAPNIGVGVNISNVGSGADSAITSTYSDDPSVSSQAPLNQSSQLNSSSSSGGIAKELAKEGSDATTTPRIQPRANFFNNSGFKLRMPTLKFETPGVGANSSVGVTGTPNLTNVNSSPVIQNTQTVTSSFVSTVAKNLPKTRPANGAKRSSNNIVNTETNRNSNTSSSPEGNTADVSSVAGKSEDLGSSSSSSCASAVSTFSTLNERTRVGGINGVITSNGMVMSTGSPTIMMVEGDSLKKTSSGSTRNTAPPGSTTASGSTIPIVNAVLTTAPGPSTVSKLGRTTVNNLDITDGGKTRLHRTGASTTGAINSARKPSFIPKFSLSPPSLNLSPPASGVLNANLGASLGANLGLKTKIGLGNSTMNTRHTTNSTSSSSDLKQDGDDGKTATDQKADQKALTARNTAPSTSSSGTSSSASGAEKDSVKDRVVGGENPFAPGAIGPFATPTRKCRYILSDGQNKVANSLTRVKKSTTDDSHSRTNLKNTQDKDSTAGADMKAGVGTILANKTNRIRITKKESSSTVRASSVSGANTSSNSKTLDQIIRGTDKSARKGALEQSISGRKNSASSNVANSNVSHRPPTHAPSGPSPSVANSQASLSNVPRSFSFNQSSCRPSRANSSMAESTAHELSFVSTMEKRNSFEKAKDDSSSKDEAGFSCSSSSTSVHNQSPFSPIKKTNVTGDAGAATTSTAATTSAVFRSASIAGQRIATANPGSTTSPTKSGSQSVAAPCSTATFQLVEKKAHHVPLNSNSRKPPDGMRKNNSPSPTKQETANDLDNIEFTILTKDTRSGLIVDHINSSNSKPQKTLAEAAKGVAARSAARSALRRKTLQEGKGMTTGQPTQGASQTGQSGRGTQTDQSNTSHSGLHFTQGEGTLSNLLKKCDLQRNDSNQGSKASVQSTTTASSTAGGQNGGDDALVDGSGFIESSAMDTDVSGRDDSSKNDSSRGSLVPAKPVQKRRFTDELAKGPELVTRKSDLATRTSNPRGTILFERKIDTPTDRAKEAVDYVIDLNPDRMYSKQSVTSSIMRGINSEEESVLQAPKIDRTSAVTVDQDSSKMTTSSKMTVQQPAPSIGSNGFSIHSQLQSLSKEGISQSLSIDTIVGLPSSERVDHLSTPEKINFSASSATQRSFTVSKEACHMDQDSQQKFYEENSNLDLDTKSFAKLEYADPVHLASTPLQSNPVNLVNESLIMNDSFYDCEEGEAPSKSVVAAHQAPASGSDQEAPKSSADQQVPSCDSNQQASSDQAPPSARMQASDYLARQILPQKSRGSKGVFILSEGTKVPALGGSKLELGPKEGTENLPNYVVTNPEKEKSKESLGTLFARRRSLDLGRLRSSGPERGTSVERKGSITSFGTERKTFGNRTGTASNTTKSGSAAERAEARMQPLSSRTKPLRQGCTAVVRGNATDNSTRRVNSVTRSKTGGILGGSAGGLAGAGCGVSSGSNSSSTTSVARKCTTPRLQTRGLHSNSTINSTTKSAGNSSSEASLSNVAEEGRKCSITSSNDVVSSNINASAITNVSMSTAIAGPPTATPVSGGANPEGVTLGASDTQSFSSNAIVGSSLPANSSSSSALASSGAVSSTATTAPPLTDRKVNKTVDKIRAMEQERLERRKKQEEKRKELEEIRASGNDPTVIHFRKELAKFRLTIPKNEQRPFVWPGKRKVLVAVRKRPLSEAESKQLDIVTVADNRVVTVHEPKTALGGNNVKNLERHDFPFDLAFDELSTNEYIFDCIGRPLCERALYGTSGTLFAYGQTGSGKTYSVAGSAGFQSTGGGKAKNASIPGLVQLTAAELFKRLDSSGLEEDASLERSVKGERSIEEHTDSPPSVKKGRFFIAMSFVELYNGRLFDLLCKDRRELRLLEDGNGDVQVYGISYKRVDSVEDVQNLLAIGSKVRATDAMTQNDHSSRSHAVLTLQIFEPDDDQNREKVGRFRPLADPKSLPGREPVEPKIVAGGEGDGENEISKFDRKLGKVTLVDLAGNERGHDTGYHASSRAKEEARNINSSLLALKECLRSLQSKQHTPYRQSKLTMLLRDSFIGQNSITSMLACITPKMSSSQYIFDTIRYAQRAKL